MKDFRKIFRTPKNPKLDEISTDETLGLDESAAEAMLEKNKALLGKLGYRLHAEGRRSLLVVLQAMDTAGKDGVIRHVMTGLNPQGVRVTSFKAPTPIELSHDFLWRIHPAVPGQGEIAVFNRSHYEDVLIQRVKKMVPKKVWSQRYGQIVEFEALLAENGTAIVKIFLHISKQVQAERLQARIDDPDKNWKFQMGDIKEREYWDDYMRAYEAAIRKCDRPAAPWYIIPSDRKWFRNFAVSQILCETLKKMNPKVPDPIPGLDAIKIV
ncbi:MAG: polyphosphate kinase 2 family protein [Kiritimatiellia bacterium]|jgi:PPK2 family polyphosphate:nucleotide phosphotransferase